MVFCLNLDALDVGWYTVLAVALSARCGACCQSEVMKRDDILDVLARFCESKGEEFGIVRLDVFGSVARDRTTEVSDVAVVVELERPDLLILVGVKQELEDLLDVPADVVRYREGMNAYLKRRIELDAVYV